MHMVRLAWAEMCGVVVHLTEHDQAVKTVKGVSIIDAKAIYDALTGKNQTHNMTEKRTAIELLAYLHDTSINETMTKWVHGESNLADSMTKQGAEKIILGYLRTCKWVIVYDEKQRSAKRRRAECLGKLDKEEPIIPENCFDIMLARYLQRNWPEMMADLSDDEDPYDCSGQFESEFRLTAADLRRNSSQQ